MRTAFTLSFSLLVLGGGVGGASARTASARHLLPAKMANLSDSILCIAVGPKGGVWIGTDNGLGRYRGGDWQTLWKGWQVTAATPGGPQTAYFGVVFLKQVVHTKAMMREARVYKVFERDGRLKDVMLGETMAGDQVDALHVDRRGQLWVGTRDRGVLAHDKDEDTFKPMLTLSELDGRPTSFAEAPDGTIYVGSFGGGVHVYQGGKVTASYHPKNTDMRGNGVVRSVAVHPALGLFVATANKLPGAVAGDIEAQSQGTGVSQLHGDKWKGWTAGEGLKSNDVTQIAVAPDGSLWFLSKNAGVSVFRAGQWFHPPVASDTTYAVGFHGRDAWVGTSGGLTHLADY